MKGDKRMSDINSDAFATRPIVELSSRPLHFIWIADSSSSMNYNGKIQSLNDAIRQSISKMREVAADNPHAKVYVRAIKFSNSAKWHIEQPTEIEKFEWVDIQAEGVTAMGSALEMVSQEMSTSKMDKRGFPPVLVLLSDGMPTDDFDKGLDALLDTPWGRKAVKIAIAIGNDADLEVLQRFINDPSRTPLVATNAEQLVHFIKWASTQVLKAASQPPSIPRNSMGSSGSNIPIVQPQPPAGGDDVF